METKKKYFLKNNSYLNVSAVMFCKKKKISLCCAHRWVWFLMQSINIHVGLNIPIYVLNICTFMFRLRTTISQDVQTPFPVQLAFAKFLSKIKGNF